MNSNQSFAAEVRKELAEHISRSRHCQKAELRAFYEACCREEPFSLVFSDNPADLTISEKCISLVKKVYRLEPELRHERHETVVSLSGGGNNVSRDLMKEEVLDKNCCRRAYLRGWFLASGTVTDPEGHYHLEIVTRTDEQATRLREITATFELDAKLSHRKNRPVVYLKEGQKVVDFLNIVGAHVALMEFENARIVKEVRGRINRRVNCETANIKKTISASARQLEDIRYLQKRLGPDGLSDRLAGIARMRLEYPEATLTELGEMMDPPLGKSAVNHRLRRLSEMANALRDEGEES